MSLPLHPEMGEIVLAARVARRLAIRASRTDLRADLRPGEYASIAARNLPADYDAMVRMALHSLAVYLHLGYSSSQWLAGVLDRAHYGSDFRRCYHWEYKANRRAYPRVTNRGVQTSPPPYQLPLEEDVHNG